MKLVNRCLYKNIDSEFESKASTIESMWAYVLTSNDGTKKSGRYRIRITKLGKQQLELMGVDPDTISSLDSVIQGGVDLWHEREGWLQTLDWIGRPDILVSDMESELNKEIISFISGVPIETDKSKVVYDDEALPEPSPKPKEVKKENPPKNQSETKKAETPKSNSDVDEDDDDWI